MPTSVRKVVWYLLAHTREGEKLPDAFFVNAAEEIICAVEFVIYSAERIQAFTPPWASISADV
jgi:hypothetical protein